VLLSARGGRELARIDRRAVGFALATALTICTYSVVDGIGVRLAVRPNAYSLWLFVGIALVLPPYALWRDGKDVIPAMRRFRLRGFAGGALQVVAYGTVLWAMTRAPIAIVASLRETSVLFGAILAVLVLKEPLRAVRVGAALLIVCGLVLIRLQ
jgi:drug/metabolite transporter (DMT)-like permease